MLWVLLTLIKFRSQLSQAWRLERIFFFFFNLVRVPLDQLICLFSANLLYLCIFVLESLFFFSSDF